MKLVVSLLVCSSCKEKDINKKLGLAGAREMCLDKNVLRVGKGQECHLRYPCVTVSPFGYPNVCLFLCLLTRRKEKLRYIAFLHLFLEHE